MPQIELLLQPGVVDHDCAVSWPVGLIYFSLNVLELTLVLLHARIGVQGLVVAMLLLVVDVSVRLGVVLGRLPLGLRLGLRLGLIKDLDAEARLLAWVGCMVRSCLGVVARVELLGVGA